MPRGVGYKPIQGDSQWMDQEPTGREKALAAGDFSVQLITFADMRQTPNADGLARGDVAYMYDPDDILQGVKGQVPGILQSYLPMPPRAPKAYKMEVELLRLKTFVKTGTLLNGEWGSYVTNVEIAVRVRRDDSTVALERHYRMNLEKRRTSADGRGPSGERDRSEIFYLTDQALRRIAENIGWDIRTGDARKWLIVPVSSTLPANPDISIAPALPAVSAQ